MRSRYKIKEEGMHFITSTIIEWIPVFTSEKYFQILTDAFKYCQENMELEIYAYVILDNHFHLIAQADDLEQVIRSIKRHTAKEILELCKVDGKDWLINQFKFYKKQHKTNSTHQIWQEGYHPKLVLDDKELYQKVTYIHNNPVKRGLVEKTEDWLYSSARNYILDDDSIIRIDKIEM